MMSRFDRWISEREGQTIDTREKLEALQLRKLNELLTREKAHNGFYKDLPDHLDSLDDIVLLPFTTAKDISDHENEILLTSQTQVSRVIQDQTSGTVSTAKKVYYSASDIERTVSFYKCGFEEIITDGDKVFALGSPSGSNALGSSIGEAVQRNGADIFYARTNDTYETILNVISSNNCLTYVGAPVPLLSLMKLGARFDRAVLSSDTIPDTVTDQLKNRFGLKLFPSYGSRETGLAATMTCVSREGTHIGENDIIFEILDENDKPQKMGEYGQVVITTIGMDIFPLIRYKTGDITRFIPEKCGCSGVTRRIDNVKRMSDEITVTDFDEVMFTIDELIDYRITRFEDHYLIDAILTDDIDHEHIKTMLKDLTGNVNIDIKTHIFDNRSSKPMYEFKRRIEKL